MTLCLAASCGSEEPRSSHDRPNILWVVWDTVRADRMSLYGHEKETTPFVEEWAQDALVFDNCISTACSTVPSHASMFTGKLPSEHGTSYDHRWLDEHHATIAELLSGAGYETYLWAANPHLCAAENFLQGFDTEEHPWDPKSRKQASEIVWNKVQGDRNNNLAAKLKSRAGNQWMIKAAGELAEEGLLTWLEKRDQDKPYFAFINYMEAHRPMIPPTKYRERMMSPEDVEASRVVDRTWVPMWAYTFGLRSYEPKELDIMAATYDATLAELDDLFQSLIQSLEAAGQLENTLIVLTADHGEHLGEHHQMDHQFSLYDGLIGVPLILHMPGRIEPGRNADPVANYDLFPTILELADVSPPDDHDSQAVSLLRTRKVRPRLAELPATFREPFTSVKQVYSEFDPSPWNKKLRAYHSGPYKLIWSSNGAHELFDLSADPLELNDLFQQETELAARLMQELETYAASLQTARPGDRQHRAQSAEQIKMLQGLGYVAEDPEDLEKP